MADLAKKHKRVTQVGTQIHATENYHKCVDIVRSGALGQITSVTNFCTMNDNSEGLGNPPDSDPPSTLDTPKQRVHHLDRRHVTGCDGVTQLPLRHHRRLVPRA